MYLLCHCVDLCLACEPGCSAAGSCRVGSRPPKGAQWLLRETNPAFSSPHRIADLWEVRAWTRLVRDWPEPHRQQDAGEFLNFLAPAISPSCVACRWQRRRSSLLLHSEAHTAQVVDQGGLWPLYLHEAIPFTNPPISLQKLVITWRNQAERHALERTPDLLVLQVNRFGTEGRKVLAPLGISTSIYIPVFRGSSIGTTSQRYVLQAIVYHLGPDMQAGHYRTALCSRGFISHVTDDATPVQEATRSDHESVKHNSCLFFLKKA